MLNLQSKVFILMIPVTDLYVVSLVKIIWSKHYIVPPELEIYYLKWEGDIIKNLGPHFIPD